MRKSFFTFLSIKSLLFSCAVSSSSSFESAEDFTELSTNSSSQYSVTDTGSSRDAPAANALTRFLNSITPLLSVEDENDPEAELYHWAGGCLMWMGH